MGSFSYMCKKCGGSILGPWSWDGDQAPDDVVMYFIIGGKVIQSMCGEYNGYGTTFREWDCGYKWNEMIDIHFNDDKSSGFAVAHSRCLYQPSTISDDDPNQGWGDVEND